MKKRRTEKLMNGNIEVTIPVCLKYNGARTLLLVKKSSGNPLDESDLSPLQKALIKGFQHRDKLESGQVKSVSDLSRSEKVERAFLLRSLSLINLTLDLIEAILDGTESKKLTISALSKGIPEDWEEQKRIFG